MSLVLNFNLSKDEREDFIIKLYNKNYILHGFLINIIYMEENFKALIKIAENKGPIFETKRKLDKYIDDLKHDFIKIKNNIPNVINNNSIKSYYKISPEIIDVFSKLGNNFGNENYKFSKFVESYTNKQLIIEDRKSLVIYEIIDDLKINHEIINEIKEIIKKNKDIIDYLEIENKKPKITGTLLFQQKIKENLKKIDEYKIQAKENKCSLSTYMGGGSSVHSNPDEYHGFELGGSEANYLIGKELLSNILRSKGDYDKIKEIDNYNESIIKEQLKIHGYFTKKFSGSLAVSIPLRGGIDDKFEYNKNRFKFYICINKEGLNDAYNFTKEIGLDAIKNNITMFLKTQDHTYDRILIYTWHKDEMINLIKKYYKKYFHIFEETPRIFQGKINGINELHIGWVQEPMGKNHISLGLTDSNAHSGRMGKLGEILEKYNIITENIFIDACKKLYLDPAEPYLFKFD